jgi:hypothetical protein
MALVRPSNQWNIAVPPRSEVPGKELGSGMLNRVVSFGLSLAISALLVFGNASPGAAKPARNSDREQVILVLSGVIGPGAYREFRRAVRRAKPDFVLLEGPGGVLGEALLIGQEIRRRGLNTLVAAGGQCASACAVVFLSGRTRYVGRNAAVGLHAASDRRGRANAQATNLMSNYLGSVGVPRNIRRRMAATSPQDIRWLTRAEQKALKFRSYPVR